MDMSDIDEQWYWDRRADKAFYPVETDDDTVTFLTVWHEEEIADARDSDALVPVEDHPVGADTRTFDLKESFRLPENPTATEDD
jgi:hypothetical protein